MNRVVKESFQESPPFQFLQAPFKRKRFYGFRFIAITEGGMKPDQTCVNKIQQCYSAAQSACHSNQMHEMSVLLHMTVSIPSKMTSRDSAI